MIHLLLQRLLWFFVRTLYATWKFEIIFQDRLAEGKKLAQGKGLVFPLWHEQVSGVMSSHAWWEPMMGTASRSKDGDYAAYVAKKLGLIPVRGSSRKRGVDKGGKEVIQQYIEGIQKGIHGGLTVDGPKGPRNVCKPGAVLIALQTKTAIVPIGGVFSSQWEFNSWDRFKIPKPFAKITVGYGHPITVNGAEDVEAACGRVTMALNQLTQELTAASKG